MIIPILLILMALFICQGIFKHLTWQEIFIAVVFLTVIRPISGLIGLIGSNTLPSHKLIVAVFGIRGIGSFYYLSYALNHTTYFTHYGQQLWRITVLIVFLSIILHGMSASLIFQRLIKK